MASSKQESSSIPTHEYPTQAQRTHSSRFGRWLAVVGAAAVVVALIAVLLVRANGGGAGATNPAGGSGTATAAVPANWQTFHDKLGLFTLRFPPGWATDGGSGPGPTVGNSSGSETLMMEGFHFTDPSEGTGTAEVYIYANPIKTDFDHRSFCQARSQEHQTFHGFPALYMGGPGSWTFETGNAHFQFDVTIPGVEAPMNPGGPLYLTPPPTPTSLPATWLATDQKDVNTILASFQPSDSKPLSC